MAILKNNLIVPKGTLKKDGVTFYQRKGATVMRSSKSDQPHRNTRKQFEGRQRLANCMGLWKALLAAVQPTLSGGKSSYGRFCTLMRKLPVVYLTKDERLMGASLLLPGMPVSDGMLPDIEYWLDEVDGQPALLTSLQLQAGRTLVSSLYGRGGELKRGERLCLYRMQQKTTVFGEETMPRLSVSVEMMDYESCDDGHPFSGIELRDVDGRLALVGDVMGDDTMGWALVRMADEKVSSQKVVTRCRLYEQYLTDEAFERAALSYGGLTQPQFLAPDME